MNRILESGAAFWDPYGEGQVIAWDRAQAKVAKFAKLTEDSLLESLAQK